MYKNRYFMQLVIMALLGAPASAYADSWSCSKSDYVREVMIEYPQGGSVPCDVVYKKPTEGVEDQVLWYAENTEGYCEEKAREFVGKLESWGWVCLETVSQEISEGASEDTGATDDVVTESDPAAE